MRLAFPKNGIVACPAQSTAFETKLGPSGSDISCYESELPFGIAHEEGSIFLITPATPSRCSSATLPENS